MAALGYLVAIGLCPIIGGYTLSVLWGWFVVSSFGAPALSIAQAYGLMLVAGILRPSNPAVTEDKEKWTLGMRFLYYVIACGFALLFGRIALVFV